MLKNYLKIAFRSLLKNKTSSAINIFGLTVGLSCCLLIGFYMQHELSYDNFQQKGDRIVRMIMEYSFGEGVNRGNYTGTKVAPSFTRNFPEVESAIRMYQTPRIVSYEDKLFNEKRFLYADSTFFHIFSFKLLQGNPKQVIIAPNMVVVTQSTARKYFGNTDPVGKILKIGSDGVAYQVTGVVQDCPSNSQIKFDFLASFSTLSSAQKYTYWEANYTTYLLLRDKNAIATLQSKIPGFMKKEMAGEGKAFISYILEPYQTVHLYSIYDGFEPNNSITYIYIISAIALLILTIACFTYINLSTARSMERAKEVGIRKVIGAVKNQIFWQFIGESVILSVVSLGLSVAVVALVLSSFNHLTEKELSINALFSPSIVIFLLFIISCISLFAGSYPALILSGFQPVKVLKGSFKNTGSGMVLRKSLIVFQFVISVFLIIATVVIQNQLHFIQSKKLGYDRDHVLVLPTDKKMLKNMDVIKTAFKSNPNVLHVSRAANAPTHILGGYNMRRPEMPEETQLLVTANPVDEEFVATNGLKIIEGEDFTLQDIKDVVDNPTEDKRTYHFIINELAAKQLGWTPQEAIGKKFFLGNERPGIIKAVIKDFHFESLHSPIKPLVLFPDDYGSVLLVKLSGNNLPQTISFLESSWKNLVPYRPFEYHFLDEDYNKMYSAELRIGKVLNIFAAVAILLACLGLFGLSSYTAQQRIKEVGIRKVLGASVVNIVAILSKDFVKMAIIATIIAFPLAWWVMDKWLQDYTFRVNISWWIFALAGVSSVLVALLTVSYQAIRAALVDPVKSLKSE